MPFDREHSARLRDPGDFDRLWRTTPTRWRGHELPGGVTLIVGELKDGGGVHTQSLRFDVDRWTVLKAKKWLDECGVEAFVIHPAAEAPRSRRPAEEHARALPTEEYRSLATAVEERRVWRPVEELRIVDADGRRRIEGLVVPYETLSEDLGGFREIVRRGAFTDSLRSGRDLRVDVEHDERLLLGRTANGTARFWGDERGVWFSVEVPRTSIGRDAAEDIATGLRDAVSAAWKQGRVEADLTYGRDGGVVRTITKATLTGATITAFPAYRATAGTLRLSGGATGPGLSGRAQLDALRTNLDLLRRRHELVRAERELFVGERDAMPADPAIDLYRRRLDLADAELECVLV